MASGAGMAGGGGMASGAGMAGGGGAGALAGGGGSGEDSDKPTTFKAPRFTFTVQFVWKPTPIRERLKNRETAKQAQQKAQQQPAQDSQDNAQTSAASAPDSGRLATRTSD